VEISLSKRGDLTVVSVQGRMDTISAPTFQERMQTLLDQGESQFVLDFRELDYISSAGLRAVMTSAKGAEAQGGTLACCSLTGVVEKVFDIAGFSKMIPIYESVETAAIREQSDQ
jgi:anti-anti-sigma factor